MRIEKVDRNINFSLYKQQQQTPNKTFAIPNDEIEVSETFIDTVDITKQEDKVRKEMEKLEKAKEAKNKQIQLENEIKQMEMELERAQEQSDAASEGWKILVNCLTIARRIMMGHSVPHKDHQFLLKNNPELYGKAMLMKLERDNPKKFKRLSEDEKDSVDKATGVENDTTGDVGEAETEVPPAEQPPQVDVPQG